jgi:hypothetical protein
MRPFSRLEEQLTSRSARYICSVELELQMKNKFYSQLDSSKCDFAKLSFRRSPEIVAVTFKDFRKYRIEESRR